jgi:RimJ/RimL family protein N-acetyltransferase
MEISDGVIKLRPLRINDKFRLAELANNSKIAVNLRDGFPHPYTIEDAEKFIENFGVQIPQQVFAIEYDGEYTGNIGLHKATDVYRMSAEIGYFLGEPYWNKGIMTRAVNLICDYGFKNLDIVRIHAGIFEFNPASMKVLEKCGFKLESVAQKAIFKKGALWSEMKYVKLNE